MSAEERLDSDSDFKPNLVNSVCYLVEQVCVCVVGAGVMWGGRGCSLCGCKDQHQVCVTGGVALIGFE